MHLPYLVKCFAGRPFTLVPIIVGALTPASEEARAVHPAHAPHAHLLRAHAAPRVQLYGRLLSDYLDDPQNLFVISSDFCHFGQRFDFVRRPFLPDGPAHASIEALDRLGMGLIEEGDPAAFTAYLATHGNTICGRHPIGVLLHAQRACRTRFTTRFTRYAQSSRATSAHDSSVSYAAAVCVADAAQPRP
jgi:AmmeMemoRadiSam system protein B